MRLISSGIVVIVSLLVLILNDVACELRDVQLRNDGTFIVHPEPSEQLSKAQLLDMLDFPKYDVEGDLASAEYIADLLYRTEAKGNTEVINGVTVAELIAQNEFKSLELGCTKEAFRRRASFYRKVGKTCRNPVYPLCFGINTYTLKLLRLATRYCCQNMDDLVKEGINTEEFLYPLDQAYYDDADFDDNYKKEVVKAVLRRYIPELVLYIEEDEAKEKEDAETRWNRQDLAAREQASTVQIEPKAKKPWWSKLCL